MCYIYSKAIKRRHKRRLTLAEQVSRDNKFNAAVGSAPNRSAPRRTRGGALRLTTPKCSRARRPSYERRKGARRALAVAALRRRIYRTDLQDGFGDVGRDCFWDAPLAAPHHTGDF
jgi:hypothetical protein